ncbi:hypothetical protein HJC23_001090 [Cyclotella cryptica]|uniref:Uncharacterized protein n=1 Tax=Cyclotella cryptica TaxID=29204 RepID=A0ABD3QIE3_9STRA|eukprot:CCRYP_005060-RA/>CCRYP_005060-RA protein AED:0.06 eAED:0.06 QI:117/1/1/1/1/1/2/259/834
MIPKIGSIGKGLATLGRRKSWKAIEPYESSPSPSSSVDAKTGFSDAYSDDAHIVTYSELLSDGAPSWSFAGGSHHSHSDNDGSTDESILSEALFDQDKIKELAQRLQRFNGKTLDHLSYADPHDNLDAGQRTSESSSAIVPAPQRHYSESSSEAAQFPISKSKSRSFHDLSSSRRDVPIKRSTSFHARSSAGEREGRKSMTSWNHSATRSHWAERKDPSPETAKSTLRLDNLKEPNHSQNAPGSRPPPPPPKPAVISRENPPPPPPRNRRSPQRYPPPPPPPPPAHFTGPRRSRSSTRESNHHRPGESTHHRPKQLSRSCTELPPTGPHSPRGNTDEPSNHRPTQLSVSCNNANFSRPRSNTWVSSDELPNRRPRQLSSSCTEVAFSVPKSRRVSIEEEPPNHRPRHVSMSSKEESFSAPRNRRANTGGEPHRNQSKYLSMSCTDESFSGPKRKESIGESLSSSMPNVLSDYPPHPKITRFRDDIDIATFFPSARPSVDSKRSQKKLAPDTKKHVEPEVKVADAPTDAAGANKDKNTEDKSILDKLPFIQKVRPQRDVGSEVADHPASPTSKKRNPARPKYDKNGRCLRHPSVIVAKKKPFAKGWDIIRNCPRCSMESSDHDLNELSSSSNQIAADYCIGVDEILAPSNRKYDWQASSSFTSSASFESNEVKRIEGVDDFFAASKALRSATSLSEAASRAIRSGNVDRPSMGRGSVGKSRNSFHVDERPRNARASVVSKMPYKTPWGESGWYTGEVNEFGVPNGNGRMRFKSGYQHDGQWANGYSEQYLDNCGRTKRGFAENRSPWKEDNGMALAVPFRSEQPYYDYSSRSIHA